MIISDKRIEWNDEKNAKLIIERGIGFENVIVVIQSRALHKQYAIGG